MYANEHSYIASHDLVMSTLTYSVKKANKGGLKKMLRNVNTIHCGSDITAGYRISN